MTNYASLPPFGKVLLAYQEESIQLNFPIYIYVGSEAKRTAFEQIKEGFRCSFLPFHEDALAYSWPIRHQKIIVGDTGGLSRFALQKICLQLSTFDPLIIYLWAQEGEAQFFAKGAIK